VGLLPSMFFFPKYIICLYTHSLCGPSSYRMFEAHMDEYLDEEIEWVKNAFEVICKGWDQEASLFRDSVCQKVLG
jgi:hypothetical protein